MYSGGEGCGSTFSVEFPLEAITQYDGIHDNPLESCPPSPTAARGSDASLRLDNLTFLRRTSSTLQNSYYCCVRCADISSRVMGCLASVICPTRRDPMSTFGTGKIAAVLAESSLGMYGLHTAVDIDRTIYNKTLHAENDEEKVIRNSSSSGSSDTVTMESCRQPGQVKSEVTSFREVPLRYQDSLSYSSSPPLDSSLPPDNRIQCLNKVGAMIDTDVLGGASVGIARLSEIELGSKKRIKHFKTLELNDDEDVNPQTNDVNNDNGTIYFPHVISPSYPIRINSNYSSNNDLHTPFIENENSNSKDESEEKQHSIYYYQSSNNNICYARRLKVLIVDDVALNR